MRDHVTQSGRLFDAIEEKCGVALIWDERCQRERSS